MRNIIRKRQKNRIRLYKREIMEERMEGNRKAYTKAHAWTGCDPNFPPGLCPRTSPKVDQLFRR